jgi:hypothetical protein
MPTIKFHYINAESMDRYFDNQNANDIKMQTLHLGSGKTNKNMLRQATLQKQGFPLRVMRVNSTTPSNHLQDYLRDCTN